MKYIQSKGETGRQTDRQTYTQRKRQRHKEICGKNGTSQNCMHHDKLAHMYSFVI